MISRWWLADAIAVVAAAAPLVLALLLTPGDEAVSLLGWDIPAMCQWRLIFGVSCPGCGLTRSFVYFAHLNLTDAFRMNWMGPPAFLALAGVAARSAFRIVQGISQRRG